MSEDMKEAIRLLYECCAELRLHDNNYRHTTRQSLKDKLMEFFRQHGVDEPDKAAEILVKQ